MIDSLLNTLANNGIDLASAQQNCGASTSKSLPQAEQASSSSSSEPLSPSSPSKSDSKSHPLGSNLVFRLQDTTKRLEAAEAKLAERDAEVAQLRSQLAAKDAELAEAHRMAAETEATVEELAHMLAAREASQVALVDTVNTFIMQQASLPATPREGNSGHASDSEANGKRFETMVVFWHERLQAQALASALKLRETSSCSNSSCSSSGISGTMATARSHLVAEESAEEAEDDEVVSTSLGDTVHILGSEDSFKAAKTVTSHPIT